MTPLPPDIEERLGLEPQEHVQVTDGFLKVSAGMEDYAWKRYRKFLSRRDRFGLRIKKGYEAARRIVNIFDAILSHRRLFSRV